MIQVRPAPKPIRRARNGGRPSGSLWLVRATVLLALALTLWFAGPRAYAVLAAEVGGDSKGPLVDLDLVGFGERPDWLRGEFLLAVARDLSPKLRAKVGLLDEDAARAVKRNLLSSPWVKAVRLRREYPDRFRVSLDLREPVLEVVLFGERILVDRNGICLPPTRGPSGLPKTVLSGLPEYAEGNRASQVRAGMPHPDPRVRAAAAVAVEWCEELRPLVPAAPPLLEVDASNLDYRFVAEARFSEVCVGLRRLDGAVVYLDYGHPPGSRAERLPVAVKAGVLREILRHYPGLAGLRRGDLRFENRWRDWLLPRPDGSAPPAAGPGNGKPPERTSLDRGDAGRPGDGNVGAGRPGRARRNGPR